MVSLEARHFRFSFSRHASLIGLILTSLFASTVQAQFLQQGGKLVGSGALGNSLQGTSVTISADGSTAIVGGPGDTNNLGAAWVFTRSTGVWTQQGPKLVGTGGVPDPEGGVLLGSSAAVSSDGNTVVLGGPGDSGFVGAVWVFVRSGGIWNQQGGKLVGSGAVSNNFAVVQGRSVAISADGDTVLVGGPDDNCLVPAVGPITCPGAVWVFTRSGGVWTQQGPKLTGSGAIGNAFQGTSVALSGDGNTALVGGSQDNCLAVFTTCVGATWVFVRSSGVWTQQAKLVGTGAIPNVFGGQGNSVALSGDGDTAIVGAFGDNGNVGAAWVFTRAGGVWTQQGTKLVGSGPPDASLQGSSVALSGDGNTALIGGRGFPGATWVFARTSGVWNQVGNNLVGTGVTGNSNPGQGASVALSADGNTALVGGPGDNNSIGAAWVFARPGCKMDPSTLAISTANNGTAILAQFTPADGIAAAESTCNAVAFNFQNEVTADPDPPKSKITGLKLIAPYADPPLGGYLCFPPNCPPQNDNFPFYYNDNDLSGCSFFQNGSITGCYSIGLPPGPVVYLPIETPSTLTFRDAPASPFLPALSLGPNFVTTLVGVHPDQSITPLMHFSWADNFNGNIGGIYGISPVRNNFSLPIQTGSGTGRITITDINGTPQISPSITCLATPSTLWPPNGKSIEVTVSGTINPGTQPIPPTGIGFVVMDDYSQVQPNGGVAIDAANNFSFGVSLLAARKGNDADGRKYTILVSATDKIGNTGSCSAAVVVPHDQGH